MFKYILPMLMLDNIFVNLNGKRAFNFFGRDYKELVINMVRGNFFLLMIKKLRHKHQRLFLSYIGKK